MGRVLITGGAGLLGLNWAACSKQREQVILGLHNRMVALSGVESVAVDTGSFESIERAIGGIEPDYVIHAAGLTSVEDCEENPELAEKINTHLAVNVAKATGSFGIPMVHISTDHLFSGEQGMVAEDEPVCPINVYGKTKAQAEVGILDVNHRALIIRTNFYGWGPSYRPSFSDFVISSLRQRREITLFEDVYYTPILVAELVEAVNQLLNLGEFGIFNVVSDGRISKLEFGLKLAKVFSLDESLIRRGRFRDIPGLVKRPLDMTLSNEKLTSRLKRKIGSVDSHLLELQKQELQERFKEIKYL